MIPVMDNQPINWQNIHHSTLCYLVIGDCRSKNNKDGNDQQLSQWIITGPVEQPGGLAAFA
jgi:hypothetical protein